MKTYRIFISAVQKELKEERRAIKDFILKNFLLVEHFEVFLFEDAPAKSKSAQHSYLKEVNDCDIYIGVLGNQYGNSTQDKISPTEQEFRAAQKACKEIFMFIKGENGQNDKKRDIGVQKLIKEVKDPKKGYAYKRFNNNVELTNCIFESLVTFLKDNGVIDPHNFDERICQDATFNDIDDKKVKWFLQAAKEARKFSLDPKLSIKDILIHLDLLRKDKLTNAAVLLFGKNPHHFFLQAEIKCLHLPGVEVYKPFLSYKIYSDNLFEQVDKAVSFVLDIIKQSVIQQEHTAQFKRPFEIPVFAIQEAIVNAVVHRNYNNTSGVQVMVFADRVEVWNSGSLPPDLSISGLKKPHKSYPANPLLANAFFLADYAQRAGTGTVEMVKQCRAQGAAEPEFVLIRNHDFRTILPRDIFTENVLEGLGLNERQIQAVRYIKEKSRITNKQYQDLYGVGKRQASNDLNDLEKRQVLKRIGKTGRGTYYILRGTKGAKGA